MHLTADTILTTGAAAGIGFALARQLAKCGKMGEALFGRVNGA